MTSVAWPEVWRTVAEDLSGSWTTGLGRLVTEDVLRFATVKGLVAQGVPACHLEREWRRAGVPDAIDLVITKDPRAAIEFEYPREPRETNAAWTQHLGDLLKDFYRLANMSRRPRTKTLSGVSTRWGELCIFCRLLSSMSSTQRRGARAYESLVGHVARWLSRGSTVTVSEAELGESGTVLLPPRGLVLRQTLSAPRRGRSLVRGTAHCESRCSTRWSPG